jgi:hypothetical protein
VLEPVGQAREGLAGISAPSLTIEVPKPAGFDEPARPFPRTGILTHETPDLEEGAPFKVVTGAGRGYFLKFVNGRNGHVAATASVRGGENVRTRLPVGRYELRYAAGETWYGTK